MGFFSSLFGFDKSKTTTAVDGIDVMEAINAHVRWKIRLEKYLNGTSEEQLDPKVICRDDQCVLGKWIHGAAYEHFQNDEVFQTLRGDHAQFHVIAGKVVSSVQSNDKATAEALMKGDYISASRKVVHALTELSKQLAS